VLDVRVEREEEPCSTIIVVVCKLFGKRNSVGTNVQDQVIPNQVGGPGGQACKKDLNPNG